MDRKRLTLSEFKSEFKDGSPEPGEVLLRVPYGCESKLVGNPEDRTLDFTLSTPRVDRDDDTIAIAGWRLEEYRKNPVVLWAHQYKIPPIGRALNTRIEGERLRSEAQFTPSDMGHPLGFGFGHTVFRMFQEGYLNAVSVGFDPVKWAYNEDRGFNAIDFLEQELLEFSPVPIPANPDALQGASAKGIDTRPLYDWVEYSLDTGDLVVPRETLEAVHKSLGQIHGSTISGKRVTIDTDEAWSIVGAFKKLFRLEGKEPEAAPCCTTEPTETNPEELEMEKQIEELTAAVKALADKVDSLEGKLTPEPAPAPTPEPEEVKIDPEAEQKAFLEQAEKILDEKIRALTGALD